MESTTKKFTVEEIRNYLQSQDSLGDIFYNLSESNIEKANLPLDKTSEAYNEGKDEWKSGKPLRNPYEYDSQESREYAAGWNDKELEEEYS